MASLHTYKHEDRYVTLYGIDHSVGNRGRNRMDDVQLIQILINRYIDATESISNEQGPTWGARTLSPSGRLIDKLDIDGLCGQFTQAAIWAMRRSLSKWKGCAIDGLVDVNPYGGSSYHETGKMLFTYNRFDPKLGKEVRTNFTENWWSTMY